MKENTKRRISQPTSFYSTFGPNCGKLRGCVRLLAEKPCAERQETNSLRHRPPPKLMVRAKKAQQSTLQDTCSPGSPGTWGFDTALARCCYGVVDFLSSCNGNAGAGEAFFFFFSSARIL